MNHQSRFLAIGPAFLVGTASLAAQQATTVEGTLVDAKCYLGDNSLTGNDDGAMKACGTMCLKMGSPAGVLTKDKTFHAIIAPAGDLAEYVGQTVRVRGALTNGAILARKAEVSLELRISRGPAVADRRPKRSHELGEGRMRLETRSCSMCFVRFLGPRGRCSCCTRSSCEVNHCCPSPNAS